MARVLAFALVLQTAFALHVGVLDALETSSHFAAGLRSRTGTGAVSNSYTSDSMCLQNNCVNPIFPGVQLGARFVLQEYRQRQWQCASDNYMENEKYLGLCRHAVNGYEYALPVPESSSEREVDLISQQAVEATNLYFAHVAGLGWDPWEYQKPWEEPHSCLDAIWRMACFTAFPRCDQGSSYLAVCKNECESYVSKCSVECCDESVACVFQSPMKVNGSVIMTQGFVDQDAPSPLCTGTAAARELMPLLLVIVMLAIAV